MNKPADESHIDYAHPSHRAFNARLAARERPQARHADVAGPWLDNEVVRRLPGVRRDFAHMREPAGRDRSPTHGVAGNGAGETGGRGSDMVKRDRPKANLTPPEELRRPADERAFCENWLTERRNAAFAQARAVPSHADSKPQRRRDRGVPSHSPSL